MNTLTQVRGEVFSKLNLVDETPSVAQRKMFLFQLFNFNLGFDFDFFEGQPYSEELFRTIEHYKVAKRKYNIELNERVLKAIDNVNILSQKVGISDKEFTAIYSISKKIKKNKTSNKINRFINLIKNIIKMDAKLKDFESLILEVMLDFKNQISKESIN